MNREEANKDELIFIKGVGYFHPDLLGIKMSDTGKCVEKDNNVPCKPSDRCGCGGKAILTDYTVEGAAKQYSVACETCFIGLPYGFDTPDDAWAAWRRAMGTPSGAIGPGTGEMAPNGDEGVES